jgi:GTP pyrophosphokinase/guanosine-3',5'-bis(diphosphate) 3'-pyrophosphohydrolase
MVDVDLKDVEHLHRVMTALQADSDVAEISRCRDASRLHASGDK